MYKSNEEYFDAVRNLVSELHDCENDVDSSELENGFRCINGLTDGWALHLDSLLKLEENAEGRLSRAQNIKITTLCNAAYEAVHRKKRHKAGNKR